MFEKLALLQASKRRAPEFADDPLVLGGHRNRSV
jgi:hypothetical protein